MKVTEWNVYDMAESIVASGFPMSAYYYSGDFARELDDVAEAHLLRAERLAKNPPGTAHNTFCSGILVSANVSATVKWWTQFERYHFAQIVSSMSTMHRLRQMAITQSAEFNEKTSPEIVKAFFDLVRSGVDDETIAYSCPMGLELTARITTNYLQLKTIYAQRHTHKLKEWRDFCAWILTLPHSEFITQNKEEK